MTILCPRRFHESVQHAIDADIILERMTYKETDALKAKKLAARKGQAVKTLLQCFGYRANSDYIDNRDPVFPEGTEIRYADGTTRTAHDIGKDNLPVVETFVFDDMAPYSFFFREDYIDRFTRQRVDVYDRCWYLFPSSFDKDVIERMSDDAMENQLAVDAAGVRRFFRQEAVETEMAKDPSLIVREAMKRRIGMCGGIIYHADYEDGKMMPYGSYSTHT